jgi:hypothetical protein
VVMREWEMAAKPTTGTVCHRAQPVTAGITTAAIDSTDREVEELVDLAVSEARTVQYPKPGSTFEFVYEPRTETSHAEREGQKAPFKSMHAVREEIEYELDLDSEVFTAGIDIAACGTVCSSSVMEMGEKYPGRIRDTP